jgi:serine palmitoyltransferase
MEAIEYYRSSPSVFENLQENVRAARAILNKVDCVTIPSHSASPMIQIFIKSSLATSLYPLSAIATIPQASNPNSPAPKDAVAWDWNLETEEMLLQQVVDEALAHGVLISKAKRLRGQEITEPRPSIRLCLTSSMTRKETEKSVGVVKIALIKVLGGRR